MPIFISKDALQQKLEETGVLFEKAGTEEEKNALREQSYWLTQAVRNESPADVLTRAFSFWEKSNGKTGLKPFKITALSTGDTMAGASPAGLTLWGVLDRAFQSGEKLDDKTVSTLFNRLPPAAQTHFIDTVENYMRSSTNEKKAPPLDDSSSIESVLQDENRLLDLVEKTKNTAEVKEELTQRNGRKIADWLRYHQTEPRTEKQLEEVLYGPEAAKEFALRRTDEEERFFKKAKEEADFTSYEEQIVAAALPYYERKIRDRLRMSTPEYLRLRHITLEKLLDVVPSDPKQLALIKQSTVKQELLDVPETEFQKRVRTAQIIRAYTFGKELRHATIRQFFRNLVEE